MKKYLYVCLLGILWSNSIRATSAIDSLKHLVHTAEIEDTVLCKHYNQITRLYMSVELDSAEFYTHQMIAVADRVGSIFYYDQATYRLAVIRAMQEKLYEADSIAKMLIDKERDFRTPYKYYLLRAQINMQLANSEKAIKLLNQAYEGMQEAEANDKFMVYYHGVISRAYALEEQISKAFEHKLSAYQYALKTGNKSEISSSLRGLCKYHRLFEDYEQARSYLLKAEALADTPEGFSFVYQELIQNSIDLNNPEIAHQYYAKTIKIRKQMGQKVGLENLYYLKSRIFILENQLDSAYHYAAKSLEIATEKRAPQQIGDSHYAFAKIALQKKQYKTAIQHYQKVSNTGGVRSYQINEELAKAYANTGLWQKAYQTLTQSNQEQDEVFDKKALLTINSKLLTSSFKMEQERQELLNAQNEAVLQAQITRQRGILGFAGFVILTLSIGTYFINKWYREKKAANAIIAAQKEDLQQANDIKSKIFYVLGHDLRGPVGNIDTMFSEILKGTISLEEFKELLPYLKKNTAGVSLTLNNILHWGLAQTKQLKVVSEVVNIQHEVKLAKALLEGLMQQKRIAFVDKVQDDLVVKTDNAKLNLIIRNLIANSIKYTPPEGKIEVRTATTEEEIIISVSDSGIGMSPEIQAKLFDNPISQDGTNQEKGTGIGLNLCKQMLEEMGGRIWVESVLNRGSTFSFSLPSSTS